MMAEGTVGRAAENAFDGARDGIVWKESRQLFRRMTAEAHAHTWTADSASRTCVCGDETRCARCQAVRAAVRHSDEHRGPHNSFGLPTTDVDMHRGVTVAFIDWLRDANRVRIGAATDVPHDQINALLQWIVAGSKGPRLVAALNIIYALMIGELGRSCADTAADERYTRLWTLKVQVVTASGGICDILGRTRLSSVDDLDFRRSSTGVAAELDQAVVDLARTLPAKALATVTAIADIYRRVLTGSEAMVALGTLALDGFGDQFALTDRNNKSMALALFFMVNGFPVRCRLLVWSVATRAAPGFSVEKAILYDGEWEIDPIHLAEYHEYLAWLESDGLLRYGGVPFSDIVTWDTAVRSYRFDRDRHGAARVEDALHPRDAPPCAEHEDPRHTACSWRWRDGWYEAMLALVSAGLNVDATDAEALNNSPVNLWAMAAFDAMSMARRTREDCHYGTMTILGAGAEDIGRVIGELLRHVRQGTDLKDLILLHYGANMAAYDCLGFNTSFTASALGL